MPLFIRTTAEQQIGSRRSVRNGEVTRVSLVWSRVLVRTLYHQGI